MPRQDKLMGLIAILALSVLTMGCAAEREDAYRGRSLALIIVEEWKPPVGEEATTFTKIVETDVESFGKGGLIVGAASGCVVGLAAGVALYPPAGHILFAPLGCLVVGVAGGLVGYGVGLGTGTVVGAVEGSLAAARNELIDEDTGALVAAFKDSEPGAELEAALKQATSQSSDATLTRLEGAQPVEDYGDLSGQGYAYVIVLRITEIYVSAYDLFSSGSRIHLSVKGEVVDTSTDERKLFGDWIYTGESVDSKKLIGDDNALLESHMTKAWAAISLDIAEDIFLPQRLWGL